MASSLARLLVWAQPRRAEKQADLRVEGGGRPLVIVTAGQRHEAPLLPALLDARAVRRPGPAGRPGRGRPRKRPERLAADKGYSYPSVRAEFAAGGSAR